MAKGFLTIKDVAQDLRSKGAEKLRGKLREMLSNPFMPADQRSALEAKLGEVDAWEKGASVAASVAEEEPKVAMKMAAPAPASEEQPTLRSGLVKLPRQPQHHTIEVGETLTVDES